jgi:hypothetical protein
MRLQGSLSHSLSLLPYSAKQTQIPLFLHQRECMKDLWIMMSKRTTPHGSCRPMGSIVLAVTIQNLHCSLTSLVLSTWPVFVSLQPIVYDKPIWYDSIFFCARPHIFLGQFPFGMEARLVKTTLLGVGPRPPLCLWKWGWGGYPWCYLTQHKKHSLQ